MAKAADALKTWDKAVLIPLDSLDYCEWNCNEMDDAEMATLISEIQEGAFDEPVQVIEHHPGRYLVLGGEHRAKAMRALDQTEIPAVIRTDLSGKTRADMIVWSVRRNHVRGRINAQKYAKLEQELVEQHSMTTEAARRAMLINSELIKKLKQKSKIDVGGEEADDNPRDDRERGGDGDGDDTVRDRERLLGALRTAEQEVLIQSADTVEHGYLFFAQGKNGQLHLVVDETEKLYAVVRDMVHACKGQSGKIDDFLQAAIKNELKNWE